jgi:hypothetical protein
LISGGSCWTFRAFWLLVLARSPAVFGAFTNHSRREKIFIGAWSWIRDITRPSLGVRSAGENKNEKREIILMFLVLLKVSQKVPNDRRAENAKHNGQCVRVESHPSPTGDDRRYDRVYNDDRRAHLVAA